MSNDTEQTPVSKKKRIRLRFALAVFLLMTIFQTVFYFFSTPILKSTLQQWVESESNGLYSVNFSQLRLNFTNGTILLDDFRIIPDSAYYQQLKSEQKIQSSLYQAKIDRLVIKRFRMLRLLIFQELKIEEIQIQAPYIELKAYPFLKKKKPENYDPLHDDLYKGISKYLDLLEIGQINIDDGLFDLSLNKTNKETIIQSVVDIHLDHFLLNENEYFLKTRLFYADFIEISFSKQLIELHDKIHTLTVDSLFVSTKQQVIELKEIQLLAKEELEGKNEIYSIRIPEIKNSVGL